MESARVLRLALAPLLVALGLAVLLAPAGLSFILGAVFSCFAVGYVSLQSGKLRVPGSWLVLVALFTAFVFLNATITQASSSLTGLLPFKAALALSVSILVYLAAFTFGRAAKNELTAILVIYLVIRILTSVLLPPVSVALAPLLESHYVHESYRVLGLGIRYVFPGDIAIIIAWLLPAVERGVVSWSRTAMVVLAALASFSRFIVAALVILMSARTLMSWVRNGKWGRIGLAGVALVTVAVAALSFPEREGRLSKLVEARVVASSSNNEKVIQYQLFGDAIVADYPSFFFGAGVGEFMQHYVRDPDSPFQYEAQIPSFAYQLGVLGLALWLAAVLAPYLIVSRRLGAAQFPLENRLLLLLSGLLLVLGSFFNPLLMLPQNYVLFAILGHLHDRGTEADGSLAGMIHHRGVPS